MKYVIRNNHDSFVDVIHFDIKDMIKCGIARITKINGPINKRLCTRNCCCKSCLKV